MVFDCVDIMKLSVSFLGYANDSNVSDLIVPVLLSFASYLNLLKLNMFCSYVNLPQLKSLIGLVIAYTMAFLNGVQDVFRIVNPTWVWYGVSI